MIIHTICARIADLIRTKRGYLEICDHMVGQESSQIFGDGSPNRNFLFKCPRWSKLQHCDRIFEEKKSATSHKHPRLDACLEYVREGDTLVVSRLDRLARSTLQLCQIAEEIESRGINLQVLDQNIDTGDATGRLLFNMLGAIAQFETEIRAERQADGIRKAKERGVKFGRQKKLDRQQIDELRGRREQGVLIKTLMKDYGLSKATVYRYLGQPAGHQH